MIQKRVLTVLGVGIPAVAAILSYRYGTEHQDYAYMQDVKRPPKLEILDAVFGEFAPPHPNNLILKMDLAAVLGHMRNGEL